MEGLRLLPETPATHVSYPLLPSTGLLAVLHGQKSALCNRIKIVNHTIMISLNAFLQSRVGTHVLMSAWTTLGLSYGALEGPFPFGEVFFADFLTNLSPFQTPNVNHETGTLDLSDQKLR